ncbi:MAG TPA: efflux RND transporter periplasmic adaptor subunit [Myxococcaceae bacterium]|nr:efflux RND transporter periplasmic adaptor subunit [Myxococcaceae bacterium]
MSTRRPFSARSSLLSLSLLALATAACTPPPAPTEDKEPPRSVTVTEVSVGTSTDEVDVIGELEGSEEIQIFSQVSEVIQKLPVKEGQRVKKGDLLVLVTGDLQTSALRQSQAALESAIANRDAVMDNLRRTRQLVAGGSGTASQLESLEAQARAAEAQVAQSTAGMAQASAQRGRTILRSPIDGVVSGLTLREGDMAIAGQPIMTIVRDDAVKAIARVPERAFHRVEEGMPARVALLADPSVSVNGTVTVKGAVVDRASRTGLVEIHLDNADRKLVAGSAIRIHIVTAQRENVVLVPVAGILLQADTERSNKAIAFVADGNKAQQREVTVGRRIGDRMEIVEGLAPGETLIVRGAHLLKDQSPIVVRGGNPAAAPTNEA